MTCGGSLVKSHNLSSLLHVEDEASMRPSGEKATDKTAPAWPSSLARTVPVERSQSLTIPSGIPVVNRYLLPPAANVLPSGENTRVNTRAPSSPTLRVSLCRQVGTSQSTIVPSAP